jgi:hypothetical protein
MADLAMRELTNPTGVTRDATNTYVIYAEDMNEIKDALTDGTKTLNAEAIKVGGQTAISSTRKGSLAEAEIGDVSGGDYVDIDTSGNMSFVGDATVWDDLRVAASNTRVGATAPTVTAFGPSGGLYSLNFDSAQHDEIYFEIQMPHNWKEGSLIYPHVHWAPVDANAGNVVWELEYAWANSGSAFGAPGNMASAATAAGGTAWVHKVTDLIESGNNYIDGTGKTISSMLVCRLHRNAGAGSDTYGSDAAFLEFDIHYEIDAVGSKTVSSK